jgi:hypothetical protein
VDLLGIEGALARARGLVDDACGTLERAGLLTTRLEWLARYAVDRPR